MTNKYLISELTRVIDASETTGLNKHLLTLLKNANIYKETPAWISSALARPGDFVTVTTSDVREAKFLLEGK